MKNIIYILLILLCVQMTSCNDWLETSPQTEKDKESVFSKEDGFRSVLIGAYIRMKSSMLYGNEMVCGTVEMLAQHWNNSSKGSKEEFLSKYDYRAAVVESAVGSIYNNLFKVIADVNGLLGEIDAQKEIFSLGNYELIKGEALAIRAFCHFDILRLFGPIPSDISSDAILPYVKVVSNVPNLKLSYEDFISCLEADLEAAENYLMEVDPICSKSILDLNNLSTGDDSFWGYRQMRMNYYAVCAMKARFYLWIGKHSEALRYAKLVIDAKDMKGDKLYRLGTSNDCANQDLTLSTEHVFNINVYNLSSTLGSGKTFEKDKKELAAQLYGNNITDIRFKYMWNEVAGDVWEPSHFYFSKYVQSDKMPMLSRNSIPMIRLYEMYLIAMECSSLEDANKLYSEMCVARDIEAVNIVDKQTLKKVLILEYNKEFYGEGQAFYLYKRLNVKDIIYAQIEGSAETYIVPLPKQENI